MKTKRLIYHYDIVSPYAYMGFEMLRKSNWSTLVDIEFVPFYLAAIMKGSGNRPPGTNPLKAKHLYKDVHRTALINGIPLKFPSEFPVMTLDVMRLLCVIRKHETKHVYIDAIHKLYNTYWGKGIVDFRAQIGSLLQDIKNLDKYLSEATDQGVKDELSNTTNNLIQNYGAFGAPWIIALNENGAEESFFGSDRWDHIQHFLSLPPISSAKKEILSQELVSNSKVPCTAKDEGVDISFLCSASVKSSTAQTHRVDLPLWLAQPLFEKDVVALADYPKAYRQGVLQDLLSFPEGVRLRDYAQSFYASAAQLLQSVQAPELKEIVINTFKARLNTLIDKAYSNKLIETETLESTEKELFQLAEKTSAEYKQWHENEEEMYRITPIFTPPTTKV